MKGRLTRLLLPLVSTKSWRVMALVIHEVLAKATNDAGSDDRHLGRSKVVCQEVHEPGDKARCQVRKHRDDRQEPQVSEGRHPLVNLRPHE
jgi:hypothetical protein